MNPKPEKEYNPENKTKKERLEVRIEKQVNLRPKVEVERPIVAPTREYGRHHTFEWEIFQWADSDFVNWANAQSEVWLMAAMAEMKKSPKMIPAIEELRPRVKDIPLFTIEEYRKKKRLGERSVAFLKGMKKRYGNSILRILYLTSDA